MVVKFPSRYLRTTSWICSGLLMQTSQSQFEHTTIGPLKGHSAYKNNIKTPHIQARMLNLRHLSLPNGLVFTSHFILSVIYSTAGVCYKHWTFFLVLIVKIYIRLDIEVNSNSEIH
jgi:hypothetical protein